MSARSRMRVDKRVYGFREVEMSAFYCLRQEDSTVCESHPEGFHAQ
jgi:hypothetical protein